MLFIYCLGIYLLFENKYFQNFYIFRICSIYNIYNIYIYITFAIQITKWAAIDWVASLTTSINGSVNSHKSRFMVALRWPIILMDFWYSGISNQIKFFDKYMYIHIFTYIVKFDFLYSFQIFYSDKINEINYFLLYRRKQSKIFKRINTSLSFQAQRIFLKRSAKYSQPSERPDNQ